LDSPSQLKNIEEILFFGETYFLVCIYEWDPKKQSKTILPGSANKYTWIGDYGNIFDEKKGEDSDINTVAADLGSGARFVCIFERLY
jgi:hypothetical protein